MANIFEASCDLSEIIAGRDTTTTSHGSAGAQSCFEAAPAPTRFVRRQSKESVKPTASSWAKRDTTLALSRQPAIEGVEEATWEFVGFVNERQIPSMFCDAHRQFVATLLASPQTSIDKFLNPENGNEIPTRVDFKQ